ncbi:protein WVD2-like 2 isoform X2 [Rutidosis leptorrhynchoides]|uniref:protein WVD2-like 2 isoform X2 n=1 Tax=Rutidosis leptorrhynchoides TaxID=125765 RepID=UPI003A996114
MGRDVASVRIDKKPNVVKVKVNGTNHVSPQSSGESVNVRKIKTEGGSHIEKSPEKMEALGAQSTGYEVCSPGDVSPKPEPSKSSEKIMGSPVSPTSGSASLEENIATGLRISPNASSFHSPMNLKQSQNSPFSAIRVQKSDTHKYHDEEDNWSMASSAATSRTFRSRVTVGVAPSFRSAQRATQRKEFYSKLEQKHEALKAEKMEYEARTKEEQEEAIKQMRKNMVVKANPVPSFYRQGPPPKVELKKLPLTRAKSPNLSRRKSCGDTTHSSSHNEALCSKVRHSLGTYYKPWNANLSPIKQTQGRTTNGITRPKDRTTKQPSESPKGSPLKLSKETNSNVAVKS